MVTVWLFWGGPQGGGSIEGEGGVKYICFYYAFFNVLSHLEQLYFICKLIIFMESSPHLQKKIAKIWTPP